MGIDIKTYNHFFYTDSCVPYVVNDNKQIMIKPVSIKEGEIFLAAVDILQIDKNVSPSIEIIQMSYLEFLTKVLFQDPQNSKIYLDKFSIILGYCLGIKQWHIYLNEKGKPILCDDENPICITAKQFDDISKIILYQNLYHYDDTYINPELKKAMAEADALKNRHLDPPTLERRIAIITAHCGLPKREQLDMTLRSHQLLFEEVCGEVEFTTIRPIALFGGKANELEHWIYRKKKDKFDGYIHSVSDVNKSMGGNGEVRTVISNGQSDSLLNQFNNIGG